MKFTLTSITGIALSTEKLDSITASTQEGIITILPEHMPIVAALSPWLLVVHYEGTIAKYAVGGGVLETDGKEIRILADMVEDGGHNLEEIAQRKAQAEKLMTEYKEKWDSVSMEALIELEQDYLKEIAREQLAGR